MASTASSSLRMEGSMAVFATLSLSSKRIFCAVFLPMPETLVRYESLPAAIALRKVSAGATFKIPSADFGPMPETVRRISKNSRSFSSIKPKRSSASSRTAVCIHKEAVSPSRSSRSASLVAATLYPTPPALTMQYAPRTAFTMPSKYPIIAPSVSGLPPPPQFLNTKNCASIRVMIERPAEAYIADIEAKWKTGHAREHTYRPVLEAFISALGIKAHALNEPKHSEHGAPDFVFTRGDLILGYAETKDLGADLDKVEKSEQMKRYLGYSNLILTDYLEFRFYKNGARYGEPVRIAALRSDRIESATEHFEELENALKDFLTSPPERIKNGKRLAEIMGGKARRIRDNVRRFLADKADTDTDLFRIFESVKKMLVHDLTPESFADMYAQTLCYGLFVARYHDEKSPDTFSPAEARDLAPESNPFLRQFFNHIAGPDFNKRLRYIVDELCAVFACADVRELIDEYFKQ